MSRTDGRDAKDWTFERGFGLCFGVYERREVQVLTEQGDILKSRRYGGDQLFGGHLVEMVWVSGRVYRRVR
jgi:hypothetical protein